MAPRFFNIQKIKISLGTRVVVKALCYKPKGRGFKTP
jgi:hypothetical protein